MCVGWVFFSGAPQSSTQCKLVQQPGMRVIPLKSMSEVVAK